MKKIIQKLKSITTETLWYCEAYEETKNIGSKFSFIKTHSHKK